ncbi:alpha/beta hydrolase [Actinobacillus succinogenes]|uniref:Cinnamoyl ester hydrolase n=1 Tax=Actinobacillus succinogenes (strain ATCC 55618 / DSM 22257 / CCUG 43843 / 130Z) TaxID=339671 RepID=A6VR29_ACTSZ|nr:alpha/beta hydrolase [Actinobacillus succinogenes]ABR75426.1 cinnamoyl ester hydrolase [Actinobacillus succinogenes 130Z]PHI40186.1 alpha/beta hydrolase [Actinobacillus succinogenes]
MKIKTILTALILGMNTLSVQAAEPQTAPAYIGQAFNQIYGKAYRPENMQGKVPLVIFAHELSKTHATMEAYAKSLAEHGVAAYVFDFRGGSAESKSAGKTTEMSVKTEMRDLQEVIEAAKKWDFVDGNKIVVVGGSQGGVVSALTAAQNPQDIAGLILMYPAFVLEDDAKKFAPDVSKLPSEINYRGWIPLGRDYFDVAKNLDLFSKIGNYTKPVLIIHGDADDIVPMSYINKARSSYQAGNAEIAVIKGGKHIFENENHHRQALQQMLGYLRTQGFVR